VVGGGAAVVLGRGEVVGVVVVTMTVVAVLVDRVVGLLGDGDVDVAGNSGVDAPAAGRGLELPQAASSTSGAITAVQVRRTPVA
jgi:hypothetical protein